MFWQYFSAGSPAERICFLADAAFCLLLLCAAVQDWCTNKVRNRLFLLGGAMIGGWKLYCAPGELAKSVSVACLVLLVCLPFHFFRMSGGADLKLAALVLYYSPNGRGLRMLWWALLFAAFWSCWRLWRQRLFRKRICYFLNYCRNVRDKCSEMWKKGQKSSAAVDSVSDAGAGSDQTHTSGGLLRTLRGLPPYYSSQRDGYQMTIPFAPCCLAGVLSVCLTESLR